jgi:hypothetical protein
MIKHLQKSLEWNSLANPLATPQLDVQQLGHASVLMQVIQVPGICFYETIALTIDIKCCSD